MDRGTWKVKVHWLEKRVRYELATKQQTVNQIINQNKCKHTYKHKKINS